MGKFFEKTALTLSEQKTLVKLAVPRWAKGDINKVMDNAAKMVRKYTEAYGARVKDFSESSTAKMIKRLVEKREKQLDTANVDYFKKYDSLKAYKKRLNTGLGLNPKANTSASGDYVLNRVGGRLSRGEKRPYGFYEGSGVENFQKLERLRTGGNRRFNKAQLMEMLEGNGFITSGIPAQPVRRLSGALGHSTDPYAVRTAYGIEQATGMNFNLKPGSTSELPFYGDTELLLGERLKPKTLLTAHKYAKGQVKTFGELTKHPMYSFLEKHNFENNHEPLKFPLKLLDRLPRGGDIHESLSLIDSGIGAGVDFEEFNARAKGTPHQISAALNKHIGEMKGQSGRQRFLKERSKYISKIDEKSIQLDEHTKEIKGAELVSLNKKGGGCFGNVCISNPGYGTEYGTSGKDYVNATLEGHSRITTYEPKDAPDFKALIYSDAKTGKIFEARGPDNASLESHPHFETYKQRIKKHGLKYE